jgi:hypothetical protein
MFLTTKGFSHDISPIEMSTNFDDFDETLFDLILKMVPFKGYMFGMNFRCFTMGENNTGFIIFKDLCCR